MPADLTAAEIIALLRERPYPTFLHAATAEIEAHCKETT